jgi:amino acid transporter/nucleotide-binding universal stress UspA family protein
MQKDNSQSKSSPTFARDLGLFDATMIGVGAMIGAGIFVLTGIAAGEAGPASILAFALNGVVTLLTAFAYAELASAIPRAGGGYSFVRMAFPGAMGFVSGWMLWFAYTVACSLYALGFAGYFWEFFIKYFPGITSFIYNIFGEHPAVLLITVFAAGLFVWLNIRGAEVTGKTENALTLAKIAILCIFIYFGLEKIFENPDQIETSFTPFFPAGLGGVLVAMGLTFIAFEGYDLIATVAEEIKDPEKNIPKATFISLSITIVIYLLILFVSLAAINVGDEPSWQFLGRFKETAIVRAAEDFMPAIGVAVIVFGGLLSTMSALNATVMAASRVAFSMGRDLLLPKRMSTIHEKRRTPHIAIIATGIILLGMALTLPIEAVGSAASLIFLLTFALVNLSAIVLRRKYPEIPRRYRIPFYPVLPILGFVLNIFLAVYQFNFQPIAWYITLGWIAVGLLLYYAVFEKKASVIEPQVLLPGRPTIEIDKQPSIVVALYNPDNVKTLLELTLPVARQRNLRVVAVSVVQVPRQMPIHEGLRYSHHKESLLNEARKIAKDEKIGFETDIVIAHHTSDGILAAIQRHNAVMLVMGWKGYTNAKDRIFGEVADKVIRLAPCDLMVIKIDKKIKLDNCLLPTSGGPNAKLASEILGAIANSTKLKVTAGYIVPENATAAQKSEGELRIDETLSALNNKFIYERKIIESKSIAGGIAKASKDFNLVVIGAAKEPFFRKMLFGEIPEKVARFSPTSVIMVKKYEGVVKSILKRIFG